MTPPPPRTAKPEHLTSKELSAKELSAEESLLGTGNAVIYEALLPPKFYGREDDDVRDWVNAYQSAASSLGWTEARQCTNLPAFLGDVAADWHRELPVETKTSWQDVMAAMVQFFTPVDPEFYLRKLETRTRIPAEPLTTYAIAISALCRKVDSQMPESRKVHYYVRGLNQELKERIMYQRFETLTKAVEESRYLEFCQNSAYGGHPAPKNEKPQQPANEDLLAVIQQLSRAVRDLKREGPKSSTPRRSATLHKFTEDGKPICSTCQGIGHITRYCPSKDKQPKVVSGPVDSLNSKALH